VSLIHILRWTLPSGPACPNPASSTFVSQSGAVCGGVIDWALGAGIGLSRIVTVGNQADLNETDVLEGLAMMTRRRVIAMYLEGVDGGRRFVDVARSISMHKPILAIKVGYTRGRTEGSRLAHRRIGRYG